MNRRELLKRAALGAAGAWFAWKLPGCARAPAPAGPFPFWFAVDPPRCIGCGACVRACREEHATFPGKTRTWIERTGIQPDGARVLLASDGGESGFASASDPGPLRSALFVPKLCNQCEDPPCVRVCPVGAAFVSPEGFVLTDRRTCVGCGYCVQACPYAARFLDPWSGTACACDWCHARALRGVPPACVLACPTGARAFGRKGGQGAAPPAWLSEGRGLALRPELRARPRVAYSRLEPGEAAR
ncbi:MAG: 4Fe-4S dicluster domain-containing protein [Planctomycetes bacterium]|nr:4Fe-4S dicluster domain-containing protein [Planctomycetota bacterium]